MFIWKLAPTVIKKTSGTFCKYLFGGWGESYKSPRSWKETFRVRQLEFCNWSLFLTSKGWLLTICSHAARLSLMPGLLMAPLFLPVLWKPLVFPAPVLHPDARLRASYPGLACQRVASHHATSLGVVMFRAWWGTLLGVRMGCSTAMRRRQCSSWMTDSPAIWRRCVPWRRWMQSWNAGSENSVKATSHWCALIISVTLTPLKISNKRSGVSLS